MRCRCSRCLAPRPVDPAVKYCSECGYVLSVLVSLTGSSAVPDASQVSSSLLFLGRTLRFLTHRMSSDNYIHVTRPAVKKLYLIATFCLPTVNFVICKEVKEVNCMHRDGEGEPTTYQRPMTVFWSLAHHQRHVTICLAKFAVGKRNVAIRYSFFTHGCAI